jgi:DNA-binding GntR family transcriptional regulator
VSKQIAAGALAVEVQDIQEAERMDSEFHQALVYAAENPLLTQAYRVITHKLNAIRHRLPPDLARMRQAVEQHRRIVDLVVTGRMNDAYVELISHLKTVQHLAIQLVGSEEGQATRVRRTKTNTAR